MSISVGMKGRADSVVTAQNTAVAMGSGTVAVFATPCMAALMEQSAVNALASGLESGQTSVGTRLDIFHDDATPVGLKVWAECHLTELRGKICVFDVFAYDERGLIGKGVHERCVLDEARFLTRAERKREAP